MQDPLKKGSYGQAGSVAERGIVPRLLIELEAQISKVDIIL